MSREAEVVVCQQLILLLSPEDSEDCFNWLDAATPRTPPDDSTIIHLASIHVRLGWLYHMQGKATMRHALWMHLRRALVLLISRAHDVYFGSQFHSWYGGRKEFKQFAQLHQIGVVAMLFTCELAGNSDGTWLAAHVNGLAHVLGAIIMDAGMAGQQNRKLMVARLLNGLSCLSSAHSRAPKTNQIEQCGLKMPCIRNWHLWSDIGLVSQMIMEPPQVGKEECYEMGFADQIMCEQSAPATADALVLKALHPQRSSATDTAELFRANVVVGRFPKSAAGGSISIVLARGYEELATTAWGQNEQRCALRYWKLGSSADAEHTDICHKRASQMRRTVLHAKSAYWGGLKAAQQQLLLLLKGVSKVQPQIGDCAWHFLCQMYTKMTVRWVGLIQAGLHSLSLWNRILFQKSQSLSASPLLMKASHSNPADRSTSVLSVIYISTDFANRDVDRLLSWIPLHTSSLSVQLLQVDPSSDAAGVLARGSQSRVTRIGHNTTSMWQTVASLCAVRQARIVVDLTGNWGHRQYQTLLAAKFGHVQASLMGFLSGMGDREMTQVQVTDAVCSPPSSAMLHSERFVWLPDSFHPTSLPIRLNIQQRAQPVQPNTVILTALTQLFKVEPSIFNVWTNALKSLRGRAALVMFRSGIKGNWAQGDNSMVTRKHPFGNGSSGSVNNAKVQYVVICGFVGTRVPSRQARDCFRSLLGYANAARRADDAGLSHGRCAHCDTTRFKFKPTSRSFFTRSHANS